MCDIYIYNYIVYFALSPGFTPLLPVPFIVRSFSQQFTPLFCLRILCNP